MLPAGCLEVDSRERRHCGDRGGEESEYAELTKRSGGQEMPTLTLFSNPFQMEKNLSLSQFSVDDFKNHPLVLKDLHPTVSASDNSHFGILGPEMLVSRKFTGSLILPKWKNFLETFQMSNV